MGLLGPGRAPWQVQPVSFPPRVVPASPPVGGTVYFVSPSGSDSNSGTSPSAPWQTLAKVSSVALYPGDSVLFQGGQTWTGAALLSYPGSASRPIIIGSYNGIATLSNGTGDVFYVYNAGGYSFQNLNIQGISGSASHNGIEFFADGTGELPAIQVIDCTCQGWKYGIIAGGSGIGDGYNGITISDCVTNGNVYGGIHTYGPNFNPAAPSYNHRNVLVENCTASGNTGSPSITDVFTGSGIILGNIDGGVITGCVTSDNGGGNGNAQEGPVGCWFYASNNCVIENSVSYGNLSGTGADGDGFDLDVDCTNCTVQYCISYNNYGAGILAWGGTSDFYWGAVGNNKIRYNLCWGNGQNPAAVPGYYGEITPGGNMSGLEIYGNTCVSQANGNVKPSPLSFPIPGTLSGMRVHNNIFYSEFGGPVATFAQGWTPAELFLAGNSYWSSGLFSIEWGGTSYPSLAAWRSATGQETLSGQSAGQQADPRLINSSAVPAVVTPTDLSPAAGLQPTAYSPCNGAGLDLLSLFGINPGPQDFFGDVLFVPLPVGAGSTPVALEEPDDVATGAWKYLSPISAVTAVLGAFPVGDPVSANAGRTWLFTGNMLAQIKGSQASAVVLSDFGGWSPPPMLGTQRFRRLRVDVWTDPLRDDNGNIRVTESSTVNRCLHVFNVIHRYLQRTDSDIQEWGDMVTFSCQLLTEPNLSQVPDGDSQGVGVVMGTAVYGVSFSGFTDGTG